MVAKIKNLLLAIGDASLEVKLEICYSNKDRCSYFHLHAASTSFEILRVAASSTTAFLFSFSKTTLGKHGSHSETGLFLVLSKQREQVLSCSVFLRPIEAHGVPTCLRPTFTVRNNFFELHFVSNTAPLCRTKGAHMRCSQTCACVLVVPRLLGTPDLYRNDL